MCSKLLITFAHEIRTIVNVLHSRHLHFGTGANVSANLLFHREAILKNIDRVCRPLRSLIK